MGVGRGSDYSLTHDAYIYPDGSVVVSSYNASISSYPDARAQWRLTTPEVADVARAAATKVLLPDERSW